MLLDLSLFLPLSSGLWSAVAFLAPEESVGSFLSYCFSFSAIMFFLCFSFIFFCHSSAFCLFVASSSADLKRMSPLAKIALEASEGAEGPGTGFPVILLRRSCS